MHTGICRVSKGMWVVNIAWSGLQSFLNVQPRCELVVASCCRENILVYNNEQVSPSSELNFTRSISGVVCFECHA
jgi:hypothetical protein